MTTFSELFGGNNIAPAQLSYTAYTFAADVELQWPLNIDPDADPVAQKIDVTATALNVSITMPPANQVSTGTDVLWRNVGANTFEVLDNTGNVIVTVASGEAWYIYVTDNTTVAGSWGAVQYGAGTSSANAASLAGAGLKAIVTTLNQDLVTTSVNGDYAPAVADRARVLLEVGGVSVFSPADPSVLGNGWFVYVINGGSGSLTWTPTLGITVDGEATKVLAPDESAIFFSDGTNFWTLGHGRSIASTVTAVNIPITGEASPMTLSASQVAAQVQDYSGTLTGNLVVNYGTGVGFWFVRNNTSGAFTLTLRVNGSDAGSVIGQGTYSIIRSNGSNIVVAFSGGAGTVSQVNTGTGLNGGPITTTGTISLADTAVTPGTYGAGLAFPAITIDQQGRITSASVVTLGSAAALTAGAAAGNVPVLNASALVPPENGGASTGDIKFSIQTSITGWVSSNGLTIGNAASGGTGRANADTVNLFTLLWNNWADAQAAVSGGRGVSAAADYAANKTIAVPDFRGRTPFGMDVLNGSANAGRLSTYIASTTPGAVGGSQSTSGTVSTLSTGMDTPSSTIVVEGNAIDNPVIVATNAHAHANVTALGTTSTMQALNPLIVMNVFLKL